MTEVTITGPGIPDGPWREHPPAFPIFLNHPEIVTNLRAQLAAANDTIKSYEQQIRERRERDEVAKAAGHVAQGWLLYCPPGHEHDALVLPNHDEAEITAETFNSDCPEGEGKYVPIPLYAISPDELAAANKRAEKAEAATRDSILAELKLVSMNYHSMTGGEVVLASPLVQVLAEWCRKDLEAVNAENFREQEFTLQPAGGERYTVTIQRVNGKTPAQRMGEEKRRADQAEAARDLLRAECGAWRARDDADGVDCIPAFRELKAARAATDAAGAMGGG